MLNDDDVADEDDEDYATLNDIAFHLVPNDNPTCEPPPSLRI